jgi:hypothetical protein
VFGDAVRAAEAEAAVDQEQIGAMARFKKRKQ